MSFDEDETKKYVRALFDAQREEMARHQELERVTRAPLTRLQRLQQLSFVVGPILQTVGMLLYTLAVIAIAVRLWLAPLRF